MTSRLAGKVAVITGGSRGLGHTVEHQALGFPQILGRTLAYQAKRLLGRAPALQPLAIRIVEGRRSHQHG